ncbi:MAG: SapC family protein [Gammaproteobacteria bacterium]
MTTQVQFYELVTPISVERHGEWSVETGIDYSFAAQANSVPVLAVEFAHAAGEYPIVFAGEGDTILPLAVLGLVDKQNLYVGEEGTWKGNYVPAFVRRYPFVFSTADDGETFTLCIDERYTGFNREGRGRRLFDVDGKGTDYLDRIVNFLKEYQAQYQRTRAYCQKLSELELLEPMQAQMTVRSGQRLSMTGFMAVNREKLKGIEAQMLAELAHTNELELTYLHLNSLNRFTNMARRTEGVQIAPSALEVVADGAPVAEADS